MSILTWLKAQGKQWFGSWKLGTAALALADERVRTRVSAIGKLTFLPYVDSQTAETPAMRRAYLPMLKEPSIKAAILDKVLAVAALDQAMNPGSDDPRDQPVADFCDHLLKRIKGGEFGLTGLPALVESVILPGLIFGYSISEKTWRLEDRGEWKGKVLLEVHSRDTEDDVTFEVDEFDRITGLIGLGANTGKRWDTGGFVIWRHLSIFSNPGGMSDLRAAYRAYWLIDTAWKLRSIFLTKFSAGPMLKGTFTDSGAQKTQLEAALEEAKAATWITIPDGALVEAMDLAMRGTADFKAAIDDLKSEVMLGISGAMLQSLQGTTTEGRGSSAVHKSTSDIRKWHIRACIESVINEQILPDATDLNFAGVNVPTVALGGIDDGEMKASLDIDVGLSRDLQLALSKRDLYKRYGRPAPAEAEDALAANAMMGATATSPSLGSDQSVAVGSNDLRATVGGSQAIADLQKSYYSGVLAREAAMANATIVFGFAPAEAEGLFPAIRPEKLTPPAPLVRLAEPVVAPIADPVPVPVHMPIAEKPDLLALAIAFLQAKRLTSFSESPPAPAASPPALVTINMPDPPAIAPPSPPDVHVYVPEHPSPPVHVEPAVVNIAAAAAPNVNVAPPSVHVAAPNVNVQVPEEGEIEQAIERDAEGRIVKIIKRKRKN